MNRWKRGFEITLWNSRLLVVFAVIPSIAVGVVLFGVKAQTPLELLYVGATIALIGLALYLTHGSESEKNPEPALQDKIQDQR